MPLFPRIVGFANNIMNSAFTQAQHIISSAWRRTRAFIRREEAAPAPAPTPNMNMSMRTNRQHAIRGYFHTMTYTPTREMDLGEAAAESRPLMTRNITQIFNETVAENNRNRIQFVVIVRANFHRVDSEGNTHEAVLSHSSKKWSLVRTSQLAGFLDEAFSSLQEQIDNMETTHSGWIFDSVEDISVDTARWRYQRGSSYIALPPRIQAKKACVNIKNTADNKCFVWSVLAALHPAATHVDRLSNYQRYESEINLSGLEFPMSLGKISKFEQLNPRLAINVLGLKGEDIIPLRASPKKERTEISLLLFEEEGKSHFVLIKDMLRLLNRNNFRNAAYCLRCLSGFPSEEKMKEHQKNGCDTTKECKAVLPDADKAFIQFSQFTKQQRVPATMSRGASTRG